MSKNREEAAARLVRAFSHLQSEEECRAFLEDLCTIKEILDMAQRLETAALLSEGCSYQKITEQVGISTATISRVNRCLNYGSGGYRAVLERMKQTEEEP